MERRNRFILEAIQELEYRYRGYAKARTKIDRYRAEVEKLNLQLS